MGGGLRALLTAGAAASYHLHMQYAMKNWVRAAALTLPVAALAALLYAFEPGTDLPFLPCPTYTMTGLYCPGCGGTRAVHHLLHGRWGQAFNANALLLVAVPMLALLSALATQVRGPSRRRLVHGGIAAYVLGAAAFTIARNAGGAWGNWLTP